MPNVYFASDHAGFELKGKLIPFVKELGYTIQDCGAYSFNPEDDYPDFITPCAQ
jgi:ribose 5-phosphate isomerase B